MPNQSLLTLGQTRLVTLAGSAAGKTRLAVERAENKRVWLIRLQEAASDLATSDLQEAATANDRRRAGIDRSHVETATYVIDRQKALGCFRTLPWSSDFEAHREARGRGIEGVWRAWGESDDEFQFAYKAPGLQSQSSWPR